VSSVNARMCRETSLENSSESKLETLKVAEVNLELVNCSSKYCRR
jgi:hypothetical protein